MRLSRVVMYGGSIGALASLAHFATEGLISAAGLLIGTFTVLVMAGATLAILIEDAGPGSWSAVNASFRRARSRRSPHDLCGVCARAITTAGSVRFCASCDRIPATAAR